MPQQLAPPKAYPKPSAPQAQGELTPVKVTVGPQETLWDIVVAQRPGPWVNTRQMMVATVKKNPHAFEGGNINRMLKNVELEMPTHDEIQALTPEQASKEVRRQIAQWRVEEGLPAQADAVEALPAVESTTAEASAVTSSVVEPVAPVTNVERKTVVVKKQDTLWTLANQHKPNEQATTGQMIKAIIRLNPQAFVEGSMHDMVEGAILKLPIAQDLQE